MPQIYFNNETGNKFFDVKNKTFLKEWIKSVLNFFKKSLDEDLCYVLVTEPEIIRINNESLGHDYPTDVITFQYSTDKIGADVFICPQVIAKNAIDFNEDYVNELHRVLIHAVLHLIGFKDKTEQEMRQMRNLENQSLDLRPSKVSRGTKI